MQRADRIANRLHDMWKGTTKAACEFPPKPPRMRWRTYQRLEQQYEELQGNRLSAKTLITTPNSDVLYAMSYADLGETGPLGTAAQPQQGLRG